MEIWLPAKNPSGPGLNDSDASDHDPVHQPWGELRGVVCFEGFVGCEDGKEECCDGAVRREQVSAMVVLEINGSWKT